MRGVIYARYSSDNQCEESIEGQIRECKVFAERNGIDIIGSYIDRTFSAKTDNRPDFQRMIKESASKAFDIWRGKVVNVEMKPYIVTTSVQELSANLVAIKRQFARRGSKILWLKKSRNLLMMMKQSHIMMFKTETHLHTAQVSPCAYIDAEQMVRKYKEAGDYTVFITDHFQASLIQSYGGLKWTDKMEKFLEGYYAAKRDGENIGINVLLCAEIRFDGSPNHYLVYRISKEFLDRYPDLHTYGIEKFSKIAS